MKEISYRNESEPIVTSAPGVTTKERSRGSRIAPTVRTYTQDVEALVEREGVTKTKILMAENTRREQGREVADLPVQEHSHLTRIIFILVLVLAFGVGVGIYALIGMKATPEPLPTPGAKKVLVRATNIELSNVTREDILADIKILSQKIAAGGDDEILGITITKEGSAKRDASAQEILTAVSFLPPDEILLSSLDQEIEYGVKRNSTGVSGYLFGSVHSYAPAYAGLLDWEKNLARDLLPVINPSFPRKRILELRERPFKDERMDGTDARVLRDPDGVILFAYAIVNKRTLIIAGSDVVLRSLIERATTQEKVEK